MGSCVGSSLNDSTRLDGQTSIPFSFAKIRRMKLSSLHYYFWFIQREKMFHKPSQKTLDFIKVKIFEQKYSASDYIWKDETEEIISLFIELRLYEIRFQSIKICRFWNFEPSIWSMRRWFHARRLVGSKTLLKFNHVLCFNRGVRIIVNMNLVFDKKWRWVAAGESSFTR